MTTQLFWQNHTAVTLTEILQRHATAFQDAVGLFYSPGGCCLAKVSGQSIDHPTAVDLQTIFEARIFNPNYELRWLNQNSGQGDAVLLSEQRLEEATHDAMEAIATLDQTYILWGEGMTSPQLPSGWSRLATARIGKLDIPLAGVATKQRVQLKVKEYLTVSDEHGNVGVGEERLLSLSLV
jgi:CRISPR-associated protein (TIGR03984 family)